MRVLKNFTPVLATLLFMLPSASFAAALTPQQSSSLIAVVQSSPGTPASAFVSLITAFSNITITQATSLITVVQAAPNVPATAFVDLLTSFTVDTTVTQSIAPAVTPPVTLQTAPTPAPAPVAQSPVMTPEIVIKRQEPRAIEPNALRPYGGVMFVLYVTGEDGKSLHFAPITMTAPDNIAGNSVTSPTNGIEEDGTWTVGIPYYPTSAGEKTITFTSGGLTKSATLTF